MFVDSKNVYVLMLLHGNTQKKTGFVFLENIHIIVRKNTFYAIYKYSFSPVCSRI
jgi:hypothetical protein